MRSVGLHATVLSVAIVFAACAVSYEMERALPVSAQCVSSARAADAADTAGAAARAGADRGGAEAGRPGVAEGFRWYRAAEERDRELAARWCATVGAPVVVLEPHPDVPAWIRGGGVEVVSWNTYLGGGDLELFLQNELGLTCTATGPVFSSGARPFVLMAQEVFRRSSDLPTVENSSVVPWMMGPEGVTSADPDVIELAARCGLSLVYVPSARNGPDTGPRPGEDKGNAILSTLPLRDPIALDLPLEAGRKVAVAASVRAPGGETVRMVSVHLDVASTFVRTLLTGNQTRARQAAGLIDGLAEAEADGPGVDATLVGSDLNTWAVEERALRLMALAFPQSPDPDRFGTRGSLPMDHLHFRHDPGVGLALVGYARVEETYGSDHRGRRATLRHEAPAHD